MTTRIQQEVNTAISSLCPIRQMANCIEVSSDNLEILQNEEEVTQLVNFCIREKVGSISDAHSFEEFVKVVKEFEILIEKELINSFNENDFSALSALSKIQCYLNIAYKYAGN